MTLTSAKIDLLIKQSESQGKNLQVSSNGNLYTVKYCSDSQFVRTNNGLVAINSIDGYKFVDTPERTDSDDSITTAYDDPFSANIMMGGFTSSPIHSSDRSKQDALRNELSTAISGNTQQKRDFRERRDTAYLGNQKTDSGNVVTLPPIQLSDSQKQTVKSMIESGEDGKAIQSQFGRIDQADLKEICDEIGLDPLDRILRFLA